MGAAICPQPRKNTECLTADQKPVYLVPGMVSNALEANTGNGWETCWCRPNRIVQSMWQLELEMFEDESGHVATRSVDGAEVRLVEGLDGVCNLNPGRPIPIELWQKMTDTLADEYSVVPLNYDWRRWGEVAFSDSVVDHFAHDIEHCCQTTGEKATIIGHSMGSSVVLYSLGMLGREWTLQHIDAVILCGPACMGTPVLFPSFACGPMAATMGMLPADVQHKLAHITSTWPCMPSEFPLDVGGVRTFDPAYPFVTTPSKSYCLQDVQAFLNDTAACAEKLNTERQTDQYDFGKFGAALWPGVQSLASSMVPPPVPVHLIYSAGQKCPTKWAYPTDNLLDQPQPLEFQPGDNTVVASSVERLAAQWQQVGCDVTLHKTPDNVDHRTTIQDDFVLDLVPRILSSL